jgi:uncharacterized protein
MKRLILMLVLLGATSPAFAESSFHVSGNGRVFYEPDAYDLSFGIVTDHADVQQCKAAHLATLEKVKTCLDESKDNIISLKQDATRLESVYKNNDQNERFLRFTTAYVARVRDTKSLLPLQEGLITAGVTNIFGLDMFSEKLPQLIEQARKAAISDAKTKAELAASELGWVLTGAQGVSFQEADWNADRKASVNYGTREYVYDASKRPDFTTFVTSQVSITFTFEQKK